MNLKPLSEFIGSTLITELSKRLSEIKNAKIVNIANFEKEFSDQVVNQYFTNRWEVIPGGYAMGPESKKCAIAYGLCEKNGDINEHVAATIAEFIIYELQEPDNGFRFPSNLEFLIPPFDQGYMEQYGQSPKSPMSPGSSLSGSPRMGR